MRLLRFLVVPLVFVLMFGCDLVGEISLNGSGDIETIEEEISGFNRVEASHSFKVDIVQGESFKVVVRTDDNVVDRLNVHKSGDSLILELESNRQFILSNVTLEADVVMPELAALDLSGASQATISGFSSSSNFTADVSGASKLTGDLEAGDVNLELSGASNVDISGSGDDLTLEVSGASKAELAEFMVGNATVGVSGASEATVYASGALQVDASGASRATYLGEPESVSQDTSGASTVERR